MKKDSVLITTLIVVLVLIFVLPVMTGLADQNLIGQGDCGEHLKWKLYDTGVLEITGTGDMTDFVFAAPWHEYYGNGLYYYDLISSIEISEGVTSIGNNAFQAIGISVITDVTLPSSLTKIGTYAFCACNNLKSITIPASVTEIGASAFESCSSLNIAVYENSEAEKYVKDNKLNYTTIHSLIQIQEKAATCTEDGNFTYWTCGNCDKLFSDAEGENEINLQDITTLALGHNVEAWTTITPASCTDNGVKTGACTRCTVTVTEGIPATGHLILNYHEAKAATCAEAGNQAYWSCDQCGKFFSDEQGTSEISANTLFQDAPLGHNTTEHPATDATCTTAGNSAYWSCDRCNKFFSDADGKKEIEANSWDIGTLEHNMTEHPATDATCTTAGNSAYWSCDRCNKFFSDAQGTTVIETDSWVIGSQGHHMTAHSAVDATCTTAGNSAYWSCDRCNKSFSDAQGTTKIDANSWVIGALGHHMIAHSAVIATCTTAGNSAYWSCDQCQKHFSDENGNNEIEADSWKIGALGHDMTGHSAVDATCTTAGNSAYWSCGRCGKYFSDAEGNTEIAADSWVISATGHSWSAWSQTTAPTCTEKGEEKRTCSNCKIIETEGISATGHTITPIAAKDATCTTDGNSAYWYCGRCEEFFSDENGENKIEANSWVKEALGHNMTAHLAVAATCTSAGNSAYWCCDRCKKFFSNENGENEIETNSWVIDAPGHNMTAHPAVAATCTSAGNSAYWFCARCEKYFSDENGENEIETNSWVIDAPGHNMTAHPAAAATCTSAGNSAYWFCARCEKYFSDENGENEINENSWVIDALGHDMAAHPAVAANCTTAGNSAYWYCERCKEYFSDENGRNKIEANSWISGSPLGHQMTEHPAVGATCVKPGNSAYRSCSRCGGFFSDAGGETAIEENSWVIAASGHSMQATAAKEATCTTDGNSAYWYCETCGNYYNDAEGKKGINEKSWIIPMTGHRLSETPAGEATCTEAATCACWTCETCGKIFSDANGETEIDENSRMIGNPLGHRMTKHPAVSATCETPGNSVYWSCDRCGKFFSDEQGNTEIGANSWIIAAGHVPAKPVIENEIPATCTDGGSYEEVVLCSICSTELSRTSKTTEAVGHTPEARAAVKATCTAAGTKAYWECNTCHRKFSDEACTAEIDYAVLESALGHQWGKTTYTWSNDYQQVTAERRCSRDAAHTQKETVGTDAEVTAEATYDAPGSKTYTTRPFANADFVQQTKTVEIPKLDRTTGTGTEQPGQPGQPDQDPGNPPQDPGQQDQEPENPPQDPGQQDQEPGNPPQDPGQQDQEPGNPPQNPGQQDQEPGNPPQDPEQQDQESGDPQQQDPEPPDQESKDPQQPESEQPQTQEPEQPQDPEPEQPQPEQTQPEQPQPAPESPQQQEQPQSEPPQTQPQPELPQTLPEEQPPQQEQQPEQEQPKAPTQAPAGSFIDPATGRYNIDADGNATFKSPAEDKANASIPDTINVSGFSVPVTKIDNNAFANSKQLETVTIGRNVKTIGSKAFSGCIKLKTVKGAANVEEIGKSAFASDKALKSVPKFPKLKKIGNNAFKGCTSLTKIIIGKSVIYIGKNAFNGCANLKTINIKSARLTGNNVKSGAFKGIFAKGTIKCPKSVIKEYKQFLPKKGVPKTVTIK